MVAIGLLAVLLTACGRAGNAVSSSEPNRVIVSTGKATVKSEALPSQSATRLSPTNQPTISPSPSQFPPTPTAAPTLKDLGLFDGELGNTARGKLAPEFTARAMGGSTVSLSSLQGRYVLLVPTVVGCGDCMLTMTELVQAYPAYSDGPMKVIILNLFPKDVPESWQGFAETYPEMEAIWAVVNNDRFPVDYDLKTLGTTFLINPDGFIVYRRDHPLWADEFKRLFELLQSAAEDSTGETSG